MIVAITKVAREGPVAQERLAFEYEIRTDDGTILAFDYVHIRLRPGETSFDVLPLIREYLTMRCLKWTLSNTKEKRDRRKEGRGARIPPQSWVTLPIEPFERQFTFLQALASQRIPSGKAGQFEERFQV